MSEESFYAREDERIVDPESDQADQPSTRRPSRFKWLFFAAGLLLLIIAYFMWPTRGRITDAWDSGGMFVSGSTTFNFYPDGTFRYRHSGLQVAEGVWRLSGLKLHTEVVQQVNEIANRTARVYEYKPSYLIMLGPNKIHLFSGNLTLQRSPGFRDDNRPVRADYWPETPRKPIPFFQAVQHHDVPTVKMMVSENPALVGQRGYDGITGVYQAVFQGDLEMVQFLLASGAPANATNNHGLPALSSAIMHHSETEAVALVNSLLKHGADVNMQDNAGAIPLHAAARRGFPSVVRALLDHGANRNLRTDQGLTASDFAKRSGSREVIALLE